MTQLSDIVGQFGVVVDDSCITPLGNGLINDTFRVATPASDAPDYVLQRINTAIFTDPDVLQANIDAVTARIRASLEAEGVADTSRRCLRFIPAKATGKTYWSDGKDAWRMSVFIPDAITREEVNEENARCAGREFGRFQKMLVGLESQIKESIPRFHDMELRLDQLRDAISRDPGGRAESVAGLSTELLSLGERYAEEERMHRLGLMPKRVCHCDTKVNNMLFDADGSVLCVIDLDTVMPSFVSSDFGDFLRTAASTAPEDEPDLDKVGFNIDIFRTFAEGYLSVARDFLTPAEIRSLAPAPDRFACMQAVRFLADYINGDTYYKTAYPGHNLVRARAQHRLLKSMIEHTDEKIRIIESCLK